MGSYIREDGRPVDDVLRLYFHLPPRTRLGQKTRPTGLIEARPMRSEKDVQRHQK